MDSLLAKHLSHLSTKDKCEFRFKYGADKETGNAVIQEFLCDSIVTSYLDTKDTAIKKALIELGWTPPKDSTETI